MAVTLPLPARAHMGAADLERELITAVASNPQSPAARLNLAKGYQANRRWDEALAAFDQAITLGADRDECDGGRGQVLLASGAPLRAKNAFDAVIGRRPEAYGLLFDRGRAWLALGKPAQAAADYDRAIKGLAHLTPEHVLAHRDALLAAHKPTDALRALDQGMARLGPIASLQLAAIDMETANHHFAGALERLDQLLRQAPKSEAWIARRADLLEKLRRPDDARAERARALQLITARPPNHRNQALADLEQQLRRRTP